LRFSAGRAQSSLGVASWERPQLALGHRGFVGGRELRERGPELVPGARQPAAHGVLLDREDGRDVARRELLEVRELEGDLIVEWDPREPLAQELAPLAPRQLGRRPWGEIGERRQGEVDDRGARPLAKVICQPAARYREQVRLDVAALDPIAAFNAGKERLRDQVRPVVTDLGPEEPRDAGPVTGDELLTRCGFTATPGIEELVVGPHPRIVGAVRDLVDELLQAKVKARLFGGDHAPRLGRLVLLDLIGSGAMGTVFAAYDPRLDRKVAVKIVRAGGREANTQVIAEARALGKLAHPNVVAIHDAGELDDAIYIVMELAPGVSLRTWSAGERDWRNVVRVLREAAAGLAAAHRAGLIHRDIKPDNILVGGDRTRVVDFGLAHDRAAGEDTTSAGTPSYMAPEQLAGEAATEASDQFSFGVTLFEALYGVRPHTGTTRDELRLSARTACKARPADAAKAARAAHAARATVDVAAATTPAGTAPEARAASPGPVANDAAAEPPADRASDSTLAQRGDRTGGTQRSLPPSWVHEIVVRALAPVPADRFPTMEALAAALGRDRRRHRVIGLAAAAALVGAAVGAAAYRSQAGGDPCNDGAQRRATVWNPTTAAAVRTTLGDAPWSARALATLEGRAAAWEGSYRRICEASRVHGAQSDTLLDLRMRCLDRALDRLGALSAAIATPLDPTDSSLPADGSPRAEVVTAPATLTRVDAAAAILDLPDPTPCETLHDAGELALPADPAKRARVTEVERELDRAWAAYALGRYRDARALVLAIEQRIADLEAPALRAAVLLLAATVEGRTGTPAAARARLELALGAAAAARTPGIELDVWSRLLRHELFAGNAHRVVDWGPFARAAAARAGRDGGELDGIIGEALRETGQLDAARERLQRALATKDPLRADQRALIEMNIGSVELAAGDVRAADTAFTRAYELARGALGDGHPTLSLYLDKLASVDRARGRIGAALARHEDSLANRRAAYGAGDRAVATSLIQRARTWIEGGQLVRARMDLEVARAIRTKAYGEASPRLGEIDAVRADAELAGGADAAARELYDQAATLDRSLSLSGRRLAAGAAVPLDELPTTLDPFSVDRATALAARVALLPREQAAPLAAALLARWRILGPASHPALALAIATALRGVGDRPTAATVLETALSVLGDEPSLTRLQLVQELARDVDGPAAQAAQAQAASLVAQLPELRR